MQARLPYLFGREHLIVNSPDGVENRGNGINCNAQRGTIIRLHTRIPDPAEHSSGSLSVE